MTDPINLLEQRLEEIKNVNYESQEMINYRNKYISTILFLKINNFESCKKINDTHIEFIRQLKIKGVSSRAISLIFDVNYEEIRNII